MSEENLKGQVSAKKDEVTRIEEDATKKEASAEAEVEGEYDPKIAEAELTLSEETKLRDEAIEKAAEWAATKKEKITAAKVASKLFATLKSDKEKALKVKLKEIETEKKNKIKAINAEIKGINKEIAAIEKAKVKAAAAKAKAAAAE